MMPAYGNKLVTAEMRAETQRERGRQRERDREREDTGNEEQKQKHTCSHIRRQTNGSHNTHTHTHMQMTHTQVVGGQQRKKLKRINRLCSSLFAHNKCIFYLHNAREVSQPADTPFPSTLSHIPSAPPP